MALLMLNLHCFHLLSICCTARDSLQQSATNRTDGIWA